MPLRIARPNCHWLAAGTALWAALASAPAFGQYSNPQCCPPPCPSPQAGQILPTVPAEPSTAPEGGATAQPSTSAEGNQPSESPPSLSPERGGAGAGESFAAAAPGYIDYAIPCTQFRLRFDAAYNDNRPDRAEFFYPKCGCFKVAGIDPNAPGPPRPETRVDFQELTSYLEVAANSRLSGFIEVPYRWINPEANDNANDFGDLNFGFKYALLADCGKYVTFQFRTYTPTGDAFKGLGTDHVSLEPALLLQTPLSDRFTLFGEVRDWIPVGGTDFAGNVVRYGAGLGYEVYRTESISITPIAELVGWSVLDGKESIVTSAVPIDASGDTIINAKIGARVRFSERSDIYAGYGRALTGDVWYKDILRLEYRLAF